MRAETKNLKNGFTLIELLVVISIIGLLASVVLVSLNSTRSKARDTKRVAEVRQLINALQLYVDNVGTFPNATGSCLNGWCCLGHGDAGTCWTVPSTYHGSTALDAQLAPYVPKLPDDPLNNTARYGDAYMYRVDTDSAGAYVTLHWGIEKANPASQDCAGGFSGYWGAGNGIGNDWWCMLTVR